MECQKTKCDKQDCEYFSKSKFALNPQDFDVKKYNILEDEHCLLQTINKERVKLYG